MLSYRRTWILFLLYVDILTAVLTSITFVCTYKSVFWTSASYWEVDKGRGREEGEDEKKEKETEEALGGEEEREKETEEEGGEIRVQFHKQREKNKKKRIEPEDKSRHGLQQH